MNYDARNLNVRAGIIDQMRIRGEKWSAAAVIHAMRWMPPELALLININPDDYKFPSEYTPFYSRLVQATNPDLRNRFQMRHWRWRDSIDSLLNADQVKWLHEQEDVIDERYRQRVAAEAARRRAAATT